MMGSLPDEVLALRKSAEHVIKLQEKMIVSLASGFCQQDEEARQREDWSEPRMLPGHPIDEE